MLLIVVGCAADFGTVVYCQCGARFQNALEHCQELSGSLHCNKNTCIIFLSMLLGF